MLRNTLGEVVEMTRLEAKLSTNTSRGIDFLDHIKQLIRRNTTTLAEEFDWQHLELKKESSVSRKILQAGSRTYNFPTAVNPLRITRAWVKWGSTWLELNFGIKHQHFSAYDPDADQRADPITNWGFYSDTEFEVWPLPASNGVADGNNEVAFEGQRKIDALTDDNSRVDMDDILVSLMTATEILAGNDQEKAAAIKGDAAMARLAHLRSTRSLGSKARYAMGRGRIDSDVGRPRHPRYIP
jgi:hypothetical protein